MIRSVVWLKFRVSSGIPPGAVNAAVSAQMAMAGIKSAIPADEVIDSMRRIGNALPAALRETSEGGLAVTESARKIAERMGKKEHIT